MADKKVNYSPELTATVLKAYAKCTDSDEARATCLEEMSAEHGKTVKSLRQKLVREGVYIKKTYKAKTGTKPETKAGIVESIASIIGVNADQLNGLDNATKPTLELIRAQFLEAVAAVMNVCKDEDTLPDSE